MSYLKLARGAAIVLTTFAAAVAAQAETIRVAIGTQDTTINCATGGLLIRELNLLTKYLPKDGKYKGVTWDVQWKNFTSGAPLTNEMVADKLDIGSMADFPGAANAAANARTDAGEDDDLSARLRKRTTERSTAPLTQKAS